MANVLKLKLRGKNLSAAKRKQAMRAFEALRKFSKAAGVVWTIDRTAGERMKALRNEARLILSIPPSVVLGRADHIGSKVEKISHFGFFKIENGKTVPALWANKDRRYFLDLLRTRVREVRQAQRDLEPVLPSTSNVGLIDNIITGRIRRRGESKGDYHCLVSGRQTGWFLGQQEVRLFKSPKNPVVSAPHLGVEIECYVPSEEGLKENLRPFARNLSIVGDGSIYPNTPFHIGREIRVLATQAEAGELLPRIMEAAQRAGAKVNDSCGLHVHLDMRGVEGNEIAARYKRLFMAQDWLIAMVKPYRRWSSYCKKNIEAVFKNELERGDRYSLINTQAIHKYRTLEVRLHHGTVDTRELMGWISVLLAVLKADEAADTPTTLEAFIRWIKATGELEAHIHDMVAKNEPKGNALAHIKYLALSDMEKLYLKKRLNERAKQEARCMLSHACVDSVDGYTRQLRYESGVIITDVELRGWSRHLEPKEGEPVIPDKELGVIATNTTTTCDGCANHVLDCDCCSICGNSARGENCDCCSTCENSSDNCTCCSVCGDDRDGCSCCRECDRTETSCQCRRCLTCSVRESEGCSCEVDRFGAEAQERAERSV